MKIAEMVSSLSHLLDQERMAPTVGYTAVGDPYPLAAAAAAYYPTAQLALPPPLPVREEPNEFQFRSTNFDLLCALLDQITERERSSLITPVLARIKRGDSYRHTSKEVLGAGTWRRC